MPQLSEGTVNMLLLLGERAAVDPALLARLARLLTHTLLRRDRAAGFGGVHRGGAPPPASGALLSIMQRRYLPLIHHSKASWLVLLHDVALHA